MASCSVLKLKIWRTGDNYCVFELDDGKKSLSATVKYPRLLDEFYRYWLSTYLDAYPNHSFMQPRVPSDDDYLNLDSDSDDGNDKKYSSEQAKKKLLFKFHEWLGNEKLNKIREKIRHEIHQKIIQRNKERGNHYCVELLIACDSDRLAKLPWEAWEIASRETPKNIFRISRSFIDVEEEPIFIEKAPRRGKKRVLFILGYAPDLNLDPCREAVEKLKKVAFTKKVQFDPAKDRVEQFIQDFRNTLVDDRGWDALIFAGHSDEAEYTGGKIQLAPHIYLAISQIEGELLQAKKQGLQVAIFNSCRGFNIAQSLIRLGLRQVVIMREKIHISAAMPFLEEFCESLAAYQDIQDAVLAACEKLQDNEFTHPSAYLIPSLFRNPDKDAELFGFLLPPWIRFIRDWSPTKREAIVVGTVVLLSLMLPVQNFLLNKRLLLQVINRRHIVSTILPSKKEKNIQSTNSSPPVLLVTVDSKTYKHLIEQGHNYYPVPREFLAELVDKLAAYKPRVVGIEYVLDQNTAESKQNKLAKAIKKAKSQNTQVVLAIEKDSSLAPTILSTRSELGRSEFYLWDIFTKNDNEIFQEDKCPFGLVLAQAYRFLNSQENKNSCQPNINDFFNKNYIDSPSLLQIIRDLFVSRYLIDYSIPPDRVYDHISALDFLGNNEKIWTKEFKQEIENKIVIISSGNISKSGGIAYPAPESFQYNCFLVNRKGKPINSNCASRVTGGHINAYKIHNLLSNQGKKEVSNIFLIGLSIILGKLMSLLLLNQPLKKRRKSIKSIAIVTLIYTVIVFQLFEFTPILIPCFLPLLVFWFYLLPIARKNFHA